MPGRLTFMQYLILCASWTGCSLPCRETLPGSFLAGMEMERGKLGALNGIRQHQPGALRHPANPAEHLCGLDIPDSRTRTPGERGRRKVLRWFQIFSLTLMDRFSLLMSPRPHICWSLHSAGHCVY